MQVTVKVSALKEMIEELEKDKIEFVDVLISENGDENCIYFEGYDGEGGGIDYGTIDHIEVDAFYKIE